MTPDTFFAESHVKNVLTGPVMVTGSEITCIQTSTDIPEPSQTFFVNSNIENLFQILMFKIANDFINS